MPYTIYFSLNHFYILSRKKVCAVYNNNIKLDLTFMKLKHSRTWLHFTKKSFKVNWKQVKTYILQRIYILNLCRLHVRKSSRQLAKKPIDNVKRWLAGWLEEGCGPFTFDELNCIKVFADDKALNHDWKTLIYLYTHNEKLCTHTYEIIGEYSEPWVYMFNFSRLYLYCQIKFSHIIITFRSLKWC